LTLKIRATYVRARAHTHRARTHRHTHTGTGTGTDTGTDTHLVELAAGFEIEPAHPEELFVDPG